MTVAKGNATSETKFLADGYRRASFDLLKAARKLRDITAELQPTRTRVPAAAVADLAEAMEILVVLPAARSEVRSGKA
jgi:hypothetical protein